MQPKDDTSSRAARSERRGLTLSVVGALGMAGLGLGFAALTNSRAVLLDGLFSLVGFVVSLIALRVAALVQQPDDERFHFGYAAYEPMLNLTKGLLIAFVSLLAGWASIDSILAGGREIQGGAAVVYALVAAAGCLVLAVVLRKLSKNVSSPLLEVDAKNWMIDGLISAAVAVAFVIVLVLEDSAWAWMVPYADPVIVLLLVILSLPIPIAIVRSNWGQLLGRAPDAEAQTTARGLIERALEGETGLETNLRIIEQGRSIYLQVYVLVSPERSDLSVAESDRIRQSIEDSIATMPQTIGFDIVFTTDRKWCGSAAG
jgi:cation diffusion facilitator family transporter